MLTAQEVDRGLAANKSRLEREKLFRFAIIMAPAVAASLGWGLDQLINQGTNDILLAAIAGLCLASAAYYSLRHD